MEAFDNKSLAWALPKTAVLATVIIGILGFQHVEAQGIGNPLTGYDATTDYFLAYSSGSFAQGNSSDVQVNVSVDGGVTYHSIDVDTGSRGLYESSDLLPANFIANATGTTYSGTIALSSSGRDLIGTWVPTTVTLPVAIQNNGVTTSSGTVTSSANVLDVTAVAVASNHTGAAVDFDVTSSTAVGSTLMLTNGGTVTVQSGGSGANYVALTAGQSITYAANPGKLADSSNFGIGFDLSGAPGGTGPIADNKNQIYNALINVNPTISGTYVQGYVVTPTGIQLGLTGTDTGFAYTKLNPTIYTSTNSQPDWQTPLGQTTVSGTTFQSGSIVMDSGIPNAYISAPGLSGTQTITQVAVSLINSGGAVGYNIDLSGTSDLNPQADPANGVAAVQVSTPTLDGTYSQNLPPYQGQFFNTGRNVFEGFNMLYDAEDGYMGLLPTDYGNMLIASDELSFTPGYYADPIPESQSTAIVLAGLLVYLLRSLKSTRDRRLSPLEAGD